MCKDCTRAGWCVCCWIAAAPTPSGSSFTMPTSRVCCMAIRPPWDSSWLGSLTLYSTSATWLKRGVFFKIGFQPSAVNKSFYLAFKKFYHSVKRHEILRGGFVHLYTGIINICSMALLFRGQQGNTELTLMGTLLLNRLLVYPALTAYRRVICQVISKLTVVWGDWYDSVEVQRGVALHATDCTIGGNQGFVQGLLSSLPL